MKNEALANAEGAPRARDDRYYKDKLLKWPHSTDALWSRRGRPKWLRAQPRSLEHEAVCPRFYLTGSRGFRTQPDGLWIAIGAGSAEHDEPGSFVDCIVIEVCGTRQNLMDKRARYAAGTGSFELEIPSTWLDEKVRTRGKGGPLRTRRAIIRTPLPKDRAVQLPVRHVRVLYAVPKPDFAGIAVGLPLQAHEFLCPYPRLGQYWARPTQELLKRMAPAANIFPTRDT